MAKRNEINRLLNILIAKYNLGDPNEYTVSTYINISELVHQETGSILNQRTISRVFEGNYLNKYEYIPRETTLDILSQMAGFDSWFHFTRQSQQKGKIVNKSSNVRKKSIIIGFVVLISLILIIVLWPFNFYQVQTWFRLSEAKVKVPNTLKIDYTIPTQLKDSVFIEIKLDQSIYNPKPILYLLDKNKTHFNINLREAGLFQIYLKHSDKRLQHERIFGVNESWEYFVYDNDNKHGSGYKAVKPVNGRFETTNKDAVELGIETLDWRTKLIYIKQLPVNIDQSRIDVRIKNTYLPKPKPNMFKMTIYGKESDIKLNLADGSIKNYTHITISDIKLLGTYEDMEAFNQSYSDWTTLSIRNKQMHSEIYINDTLKFETDYEQIMGTLWGFNFWFMGGGMIDYIRCYNLDNELIYSEEFN
jgi:hypothetical protein